MYRVLYGELDVAGAGKLQRLEMIGYGTGRTSLVTTRWYFTKDQATKIRSEMDSRIEKSEEMNPMTGDQTKFVHHAEAVWDQREPYGPSGFKGVFNSSYATLCAAFAALGGMVFGYDQGVVSVILVMPQFLSRFTRVSETASGAGFWKGFLTAMIELGALIGALNQGWIADQISRKYSIVVAVIVFTLGSILQTAAVDYAMLIVGRLIGGLGIGMLVPKEIRGALLVLEEFSIVAGICIAYWITYGTQYIDSEWAWRCPFLLQMIPSTVLGVGILFLPFSPRWLASKGRDDEALHNLGKLRQLPVTDHRVKQEWFDIRAEVAFHRQTSAIRHPHLQSKTRVGLVERLLPEGLLEEDSYWHWDYVLSSEQIVPKEVMLRNPADFLSSNL
ncbi:hypothetical protein Q9189_006741 [Teloschistes chrysophthalmus]